MNAFYLLIHLLSQWNYSTYYFLIWEQVSVELLVPWNELIPLVLTHMLCIAEIWWFFFGKVAAIFQLSSSWQKHFGSWHSPYWNQNYQGPLGSLMMGKGWPIFGIMGTSFSLKKKKKKEKHHSQHIFTVFFLRGPALLELPK